MLAPYVNVQAFMTEWRSRAPPTHTGFGNQSSADINSNAGSYGESDGDVGKVYGIVFGIFGGVLLISALVAVWFWVRRNAQKNDGSVG